MEDIMISVICTAYNHDEYIEKTIQGFLKQKCSFSFEILIHDDASTDDTAQIIKKYEEKYPDKIKVIYQTENQHSKGISATKLLLEKAKGKYIALCEGDDYWNDSNKLELQISFLEAHPEYSACVHSGYYAYADGTIKRKLFRAFTESKEVKTEEILEKWLFPTASIVYRKECRPRYELGYGENLPCGDFPLMVYLSTKGKIYYMDRPMCVYRTMSKSSLSLQRIKNKDLNKKMEQRFLLLLDTIDTSLDMKYHDVIQKHKKARIFSRYIEEKNWEGITDKSYYELYKKLSKKNKIQIYLVHLNPTIMGKLEFLLIKMRNAIRYKSDKRYSNKQNIEV